MIKNLYFSCRDKWRKKWGVCVNYPVLLYKRIKIGHSFVVYGKLRIYGGRNVISIGNNVTLRSEILTNPLGGGNKIIMVVPPGGELRIGNGVGITNSCFVATKGIYIEDNVLIGGDCKFYDTDFHSVEYEYRMSFPDTEKRSAPITIKQGAWIGAHVIVLKGVTIGERSVVGAGSVVTKDIPNDEVWGGNPAQFIKKINQKREM